MLPDLDDFLLYLQANNYSPRTVYNYERDLRVFERFMSESKLSFERLSKRDVTYYKAYLSSRDRQTAEDDRVEDAIDLGPSPQMRQNHEEDQDIADEGIGALHAHV